MKVLFLDDMEDRHRIFKDKSRSHDIYQAYTVEEAIELLEMHSPFDIAYLDHDLGGVYLPSDEKSGYEVAKFIIGMKKELTKNIFKGT